jgi:hypothetical protein
MVSFFNFSEVEVFAQKKVVNLPVFCASTSRFGFNAKHKLKRGRERPFLSLERDVERADCGQAFFGAELHLAPPRLKIRFGRESFQAAQFAQVLVANRPRSGR